MSLTCEHARRRLPLREEPASDDLEQHLQDCQGCRAVARRHGELDRALQPLLVTSAPPELTARLLALVPALSAGMPIRSPRWHRQRRMVVVSAGILVTLSIVVLGLALSWIFTLLGAGQAVADLTSLPGEALGWLYQTLPSSRYVVDALLQLREPLQWTLVVALLWRSLERLRPGQELTTSS
jgi:predicted anti-sigma-YlaC factor YlaD